MTLKYYKTNPHKFTTMKITDTISVNPGKTAVGHETLTNSLLRTPVINKENISNHIDLISFICPSTGLGIDAFKKYALPLRCIYATILIIAGLILLEDPMSKSIALGIIEITTGGFLAVGLLTRPVMIAASLYFIITSALSIRVGATDITTLSLLFGSLLFSAFGSGKYSLDFIIRKAIRKAKRDKIDKCMRNQGYKAFHFVR